MSEYKVLMPKMGESVQEATITKWFVKQGDNIKEDDLLFEIATEKVDSEIPSPVEGKIIKILFDTGSVVPVGELVAIIEIGGVILNDDNPLFDERHSEASVVNSNEYKQTKQYSERFYSPLVKSIASKENISFDELKKLNGSGTNGRIQKKDILDYIEKGKNPEPVYPQPVEILKRLDSGAKKVSVSIGVNDQIIEMDRVRKLIAEHMVHSVQVAPHVTNVVEADVTNLVLWRNRVKGEYQKKNNEKLTYMPVFTEATAMALREFPLVNSSVDGDKIILRSRVNIGIAVAKPDGNLIVPVIYDADKKNLQGLMSGLNDLANRARINKLMPDEISGGTFTITNFGTFRNLIGTPIINQPQVAILATGSIEKKPAVMETPTGDAIVVRHKIFLSLSYDHRIIDGALGGAFLRRIADILESFDINRLI